VIWRNNSQKTHNVKFETEGFNSGRVAPRGAAFHDFTVAGSYPYICTIHDGMTGEIGVYPLLLSGPKRPVQPNTSVPLEVRAPDGTGQVTIEADSGSGFQPVATADPMLHANVVVAQTASYRAVSAAGSSQKLRIEVSAGPDLSIAAGRAGSGSRAIKVSARPAAPGTRVVLQLRLRERFGWWPVARARLDRRSRARFALRGHAGVPARVVAVGPDWATPLSESRVLKLPR
jgi:hypothetical protein